MQAGAELSQWPRCYESHRALAPTLPAPYHLHWTVRVVRPQPGDPQDWYEKPVVGYLESLVDAAASPSRASAGASIS